MNAALKLPIAFNVSPFIQSADETVRYDLVQGLQLLGWSNLPISAVKTVENDIRQYLAELMSMSAPADPETARRRKKIVFWVDAYLRGDCTLHWLLEMLERLPASKKGA